MRNAANNLAFEDSDELGQLAVRVCNVVNDATNSYQLIWFQTFCDEHAIAGSMTAHRRLVGIV